MKTQLQKIKMIALFLTATTGMSAQTTADLQNLTLSPNTFWNGATGNPTVSTSGTFTSGNCIFPNSYSGSFGGYWNTGWSYSNMKDSTTAGSTNQYSARTAVGYTNSTIYSLGKGGSVLKFNSTAQGKQMAGFYITNSTYAYISMKNGDSFAKKFGGTSGNDPDWFKLTVKKYLSGSLTTDSVEFYLADYRFTNNSQDYIVKTWQYVNLRSLGNADSLLFNLSSSDVGSFGMNTPSYFCIDNFTTLDAPTGIEELSIFENTTVIYPNPTNSQLNISASQPIEKIEIYNELGELVYKSASNHNDVSILARGIYMMRITGETGETISKRIIKD